MEETLLKAYDRLVERMNIDRELTDVGEDGLFSGYIHGQLILNLQAFEARYPEMINSTSPTQADAMESFILHEGKQPLAKRMLTAGLSQTVRDLEVFLNVTDELVYTVQPIHFGQRLELVYTQGQLFRAMAFKTDVTGVDCYDEAVKVKGIPTKIPVQADLSVFHGVITISNENRLKYNEKLAPRVAVDTILKSGEGLEYLEFVLQEVPNTGCRLYDTDDSHHTRLRRAHAMHIGTIAPDFPVDYTEVAERIEELTATENDSKYRYGAVAVKVNDMLSRDLIGGKKWATYWEIRVADIETVVTDVEFTTGLGGVVSSIIRFEPREMHGVSFNGVGVGLSELKGINVWIGDTLQLRNPHQGSAYRHVVLDKRPKDASPPVFPEKCSCGTLLTLGGPRNNVLRCDNYHECENQILERVKRYLGEDGIDLRMIKLGDLVLRKLVTSGKVRSIPDLYLLTEQDLTDVRISTSAARTFVSALEWAREHTVASHHLAAMYIPGIHRVNAIELCNHAYIDSIVVLARNAGYETFLEDLIGPSPAKLLRAFCEDERGAALLTKMGHLLRDVALEGDNGRDD